MTDIFLRQGQASPADITLTDPTTSGAANTTGTIVTAQAAQTESGAAREDFQATIAASQATQSASVAARERFLVAIVTSQQAQVESEAGLERFVATVGATQATQAAAVAASTTVGPFTASIATTQLVQVSSIAAFTPSIDTVEPAGAGIFHPFVEQPSVAAIHTIQSRQATRIGAETRDNDDWMLDLELAA